MHCMRSLNLISYIHFKKIMKQGLTKNKKEKLSSAWVQTYLTAITLKSIICIGKVSFLFPICQTIVLYKLGYTWNNLSTFRFVALPTASQECIKKVKKRLSGAGGLTFATKLIFL